MKKKKDTHPKIELFFQQREEMLEVIKKIDNALLSKDEIDLEEINSLNRLLESKESFDKLTHWLQKQISIDPDIAETRLKNIVNIFENEFPAWRRPTLDKIDKVSESIGSITDDKEKPHKSIRSQVVFIAMTWLDNALVLHIIGHNSAAIIELYGALERFVINSLTDLLIVPEKKPIGLKLIERRTLPDLALLLSDCGVFEKKDINFCNRLSRLRNGLAHRNTEVISRAILGGKEISDVELDIVVTDATFFEYLFGTIRTYTTLMESEAWKIDSKQFPLGFLNEDD